MTIFDELPKYGRVAFFIFSVILAIILTVGFALFLYENAL